MGETLKNLLRNHKTKSFHILCVAMYSGPQNPAKRAPGVHTGPARGGGGGGGGGHG